jgi:prepilin-type N-terminal cleavage/methylation domain-containing protein
MQRAPRRNGFTMLELMVVVGVIGLLAAAGVPSWRAVTANSRLREAAGDVADALVIARARAVASGDYFVVYFNTGINSGEDVCGNPLEDQNGNPVPILILDDGPPGGANFNCCIDAGEEVRTLPAAQGVQWGVDFAAAAAPGDADPSVNFAAGTSFVDPAGVPTEWVVFRPDGIPLGFADTGGACSPGQTGTGGGAVYVNNDRRDIAVVLTPLGNVKVHRFERTGGAWTN